MSVQEQKTILLVEDEDNSARITARILKSFGFGVIIANTGEAAVEIVSGGETIDIILMDVDLGNGIDGTRAAVLILEKRNIPIVFMTAHTEKEYVDKIKEITRYGYIVKNSGVFVMRSSIEMALELFDARVNIESRVKAKTEELQKSEKETKTQNEYHVIITETIRRAYNSDDPAVFLSGVFELVSRRTGLRSIHVFEDLSNDAARIVYECKNDAAKDIPAEFNYGKVSSWKKHLVEESMINYPADKYLSADILQYFSAIGSLNFFVAPLFINNSYHGFVVFTGETAEELWEECVMMLFFPISGILSTTIEKYKTAKKLQESFRYSRNLIESSLDAMVTISSEGKITDANTAAEKLTGVPREKLIGSDFSNHFTDPEKAGSGYREVFKEGFVRDFPLAIKNADGKITDVLYNSSLYQNEDGSTAGVFATARDITERKTAEEKIKKLLEEKEFILKEVHHRIKNNMNTVAGIMWMQAGSLKDPEAKAAFKDARTRVLSMMVLYDKIYRSDGFKETSFKEYISPLVDEIAANFPNNRMVKIVKNIDDFMVDAEKSSYIGILVNELITNIMKYAFAGMDAGVITISARVVNDRVTMIIADDGIGIPESVDIETAGGFGLQLVDMMTHSLRGAIRIERGRGTRFILEFGL